MAAIGNSCFFGSFGRAVSEKKKSSNQKQKLPVAAMFVNRSGRK
jgi:fluoride ion exporter CrcB/FEX